MPVERARGHEDEIADARHQPRERIDRLGPLQREQGLVLEMIDRNAIGQEFEQMRDIVDLGRAVDDHVEGRRVGIGRRRVERRPARGFRWLDRFFIRGERARGGQVRDHQIVEDAAILGEQQRIALLVLGKASDVGREQRFERRDHVRAALGAEDELAHMADVEQPGRVAHPQMLGHDAFILDGHVIAGEFDHPPALRAVPAIERQSLRRDLVGNLGVAHVGPSVVGLRRGPTRLRRRPTPPPLSRIPESFDLRMAGLPLRWPRQRGGSAFQSVVSPRGPVA